MLGVAFDFKQSESSRTHRRAHTHTHTPTHAHSADDGGRNDEKKQLTIDRQRDSNRTVRCAVRPTCEVRPAAFAASNSPPPPPPPPALPRHREAKGTGTKSPPGSVGPRATFGWSTSEKGAELGGAKGVEPWPHPPPAQLIDRAATRRPGSATAPHRGRNNSVKKNSVTALSAYSQQNTAGLAFRFANSETDATSIRENSLQLGNATSCYVT